MLVMARALMTDLKLLLLDEPTMGLSPLLTAEIFRILKRINDNQKTTVLLVEQNARAALSYSHYAYIIESGRIALEGTAKELLENADIKEFYLGMSSVGKKKAFRDIKHYKRRKRWMVGDGIQSEVVRIPPLLALYPTLRKTTRRHGRRRKVWERER